jgi:hypothetical protein
MGGQSIDFTDADLTAVAASYDTGAHEAPICIGHPQHDAPAYGWVKGIQFADGLLTVDAEDVDPAFADLVKAKRFKKVSAAFYAPDSPNNPKPGSYYLRHVGFLGAQPPAVKGLKQVAFATDDDALIFADGSDMTVASVLRNMRDWMIGKFGQEDADKAIPGDMVDSIRDGAIAAAGDDAALDGGINSSSYAEGDGAGSGADAGDGRSSPADAERAAELDAREKALADREVKFAEQERLNSANGRKAELLTFAEGLVREGKLLPVERERVVAVLAALDPAGTVTFGEGDKALTETVIDSLKTVLSGLPKRVEFAEIVKPVVGVKDAGFVTPPGTVVDEGRLELHNQTVAFQEANPGTDYSTALKKVAALNGEPA